jgi:hypothetical protein
MAYAGSSQQDAEQALTKNVSELTATIQVHQERDATRAKEIEDLMKAVTTLSKRSPTVRAQETSKHSRRSSKRNLSSTESSEDEDHVSADQIEQRKARDQSTRANPNPDVNPPMPLIAVSQREPTSMLRLSGNVTAHMNHDLLEPGLLRYVAADETLRALLDYRSTACRSVRGMSPVAPVAVYRSMPTV